MTPEDHRQSAASDGGATPWRWWIALALAMAAVAVFFVSRTDSGWRVCEDVVAATGPRATAAVCRPIGSLELSILLFPIAVLLFPDVAELAIPGLISLKRDVAVQSERQERLEKSLVQVEQRVSQVQNLNIFNYPTEKLARLADKEEAFERGGHLG